MLPEVLVHDSGCNMYGVNRIDTSIEFQWTLPVDQHKEDTTASGYQQNTISRSDRHDLLLQKIVVLVPPYSQSYGAAI